MTLPKSKPPKRPRGRPSIKPPVERIDASPETIAEVVLRAKPKETWRYEQERADKS